jgi:hypothetical protein
MTIEQTIDIPEAKPPKMSRQMKKLMKYYGCLKDSPAFAGDSVELIRKMRDEWDRPWDTLINRLLWAK